MRIVFDEHTPRAVAHALRPLVAAENVGQADPVEVWHALDLFEKGLRDTILIERVADGTHARAALVTSDKAMRTRQHERAAFTHTGCIGIVLRGQWAHAAAWDRAVHTLCWWSVWVETVAGAAPGTLWQCPWSMRPKRLVPF